MVRYAVSVVALYASLGLSMSAGAQEVIGEFRPRPPEMVVDGDRLSGPLKDVIEEALAPLGLSISWTNTPFARSLTDLQDAAPVLVPRILMTPERQAFTLFLGPIADYRGVVLFAVRKGEEHRIKLYDDLRPFRIGTKRGTVYFERFDRDTTLDKQQATDDAALLRLLQGGRIDAAAIIDPTAFDVAARAAGWGGYGWADYTLTTKQAVYYGIAKRGPLAPKAAVIDAQLRAMVANGRIAEIYAKYGLVPETED